VGGPGGHGRRADNNAIITEILQLRAERARLLGYETHAHWRLENTMAGTPERAMELMEAVWTPAVARVARGGGGHARPGPAAEGVDITIEPWDYRYYAEKVRKERYDLDQNEVKPYLQLDRCGRACSGWPASSSASSSRPSHDVPVFHPDVRVWEVTDRDDGRHVGLFYFDPYARAGKRSGAWMTRTGCNSASTGRDHAGVQQPELRQGRPGEPVLISWDDAETLFHEFGHALHGLASSVTYPSLSGTAVPRDYVEFPSQILEHWLSTPEVLQRFAVHYRTGEPIPQGLVDRIERRATFNQGFATTEYLASGLVDMKLHLAGDRRIDPATFERETLEALGMPREIVMRHRTPQFGHVFGSDGYSAGYYSYLWSDVLTADAFEAFLEAGGPYDREVARRLYDHVFSVGNMTDPAERLPGFPRTGRAGRRAHGETWLHQRQTGRGGLTAHVVP
jgi:peptidyl-dipeptidase Dcp